MAEKQTSYRQILKATTIFGGVQIINIVISVVRSKFVAVILGPTGMGIAGLLYNTLNFIGSITNFGLGTSAVKDVAAANKSGDQKRIAIVITVFRRLVWITGILGTLLIVVFSSFLSQITFGNKHYTLAFIWVSISLLFAQLSSGQLVILQGLQKIKLLAKANVYGSLFGLITTIPLYYIWGLDGIVPGIIIVYLVSFCLSWYLSRKIKIEKIKVTFNRTLVEGKSMLTMGFLISLNGLVTLGISYITRLYVSNKGGVEQVGLFNAGFSIINTYVGMIFSAMGTDYYPRLSAIAESKLSCRKTMNQQAEIAILILAPIMTVFIIYIDWIVIMLYSKQFIPVNNMILWAALGMFFKTTCWVVGFLFLAKGESKTYFFSELVINIYFLLFNIIGYYYWGLTGLGISFFVGYILAFLQVYLIARIKWGFYFEREFLGIFIIQLICVTGCYLLVKLTVSPYSYLLGSSIILFSSYYSFRKLNQKIDIIHTLKSYNTK